MPELKNKLTILNPVGVTPVEYDYVTGLVSYWKYDDNGNDSWGSNNGTMQGTILYSEDAIIGKAMNSPGSNDYMLVPDDDSLSFVDGDGDTDFTIMTWVKFAALGVSRTILDKRASSTNMEYRMIWQNNNKMVTQLWSGGGTADFRRLVSDWAAVIDEWYNVAVTYESGILTQYLNGYDIAGTQSDTGTYTGMVNGNQRLAINSNFEDLAGKHDLTTIWKGRALTAAEILHKVKKESAGIDVIPAL